MIDLKRATWLTGAVVLLGLFCVCVEPVSAQRGFRPPAYRPPPTPPPTYSPLPMPAISGGGIRPGTYTGGSAIGSFSGSRPGTFAGSNLGGSGSFSGSTYYRPAYRPASMVTGEITGLTTKSPSGALKQLGGAEARDVLTVTARTALAKVAIESLAVKVESRGTLPEAMREIKAARDGASGLPESTRTELTKLARTAERRFVEKCLDDVGFSLERGQWKDVSEKVDGWGRQVRGQDWPAGSELVTGGKGTYQLKGPAREALIDARKIADRLGPIDRFEKLLKDVDIQKAGESADALARVDLDKLPRSLGPPADGLRGLAEVKRLAGQKWTNAPDAAEVKAAVGRFERGLGEATGAD